MTVPANLLQESAWRAALFILTSRTFRRGEPDVWNHIDLPKERIFFKRMLKGRGWSSTEDLMIRAAWSLFTYGEDNEVNLYDLVNRLGGDQFSGLPAFPVICVVPSLSATFPDGTTLSGRSKKRSDFVYWRR